MDQPRGHEDRPRCFLGRRRRHHPFSDTASVVATPPIKGLSRIRNVFLWAILVSLGQLLFLEWHVLLTNSLSALERWWWPLFVPDNQEQHISEYRVNHSMIHDQTLHWDPNVNRIWLHPDLQANKQPHVPTTPAAMLLLTAYGWNQPDQAVALQGYARRIRETELMQAVINHRWFHPTAWEDYELHNATYIQHLIRETTTRFYIFLDYSTNNEVHYPIYGGHDRTLDTKGGRVNQIRGRVKFDQIASQKVWSSHWLQSAPQDRIKVIVLEGSGWGPHPGSRNPRFATKFPGIRPTWNLPLALVSTSAILTNVNQSVDQGLMPPMIKKVQLSNDDIQDIDSCQAEHRRRFLLTYTGNLRSGQSTIFHARGSFREFDDGKRVLIRRYFLPEYNNSVLGNLTYEEVLSNSVFSLAARGDNKYSYKFSEILSAGAIPVVLSDDWMYPFRPELVDWSECAVIMPEKDAGEPTMAVLKALSEEQRCRMRKRCYDIYRKYVEHPEGVLDGIVQGLELVANGVRKPMFGVKCTLGQGEWKGEGWLREKNVSEPDVRLCNLM